MFVVKKFAAPRLVRLLKVVHSFPHEEDVMDDVFGELPGRRAIRMASMSNENAEDAGER